MKCLIFFILHLTATNKRVARAMGVLSTRVKSGSTVLENPILTKPMFIQHWDETWLSFFAYYQKNPNVSLNGLKNWPRQTCYCLLAVRRPKLTKALPRLVSHRFYYDVTHNRKRSHFFKLLKLKFCYIFAIALHIRLFCLTIRHPLVSLPHLLKSPA